MTLEDRIRRLAAELPEEECVRTVAAAGRLASFLSFLLEKNETMNLVSTRSAEPGVLAERHLFDSLLGLTLLPRPRVGPVRVLDLGSGGGFPAVPLLIVRTDLEGTLVESSGKKAGYLREAAARLSLTAGVVNARFPDAFPTSGHARYDVLTTRAVAAAGKLVHSARPLLTSDAKALLWTSEPLAAEAVRTSGARRSAFHRTPGAERRGILSLECFT